MPIPNYYNNPYQQYPQSYPQTMQQPMQTMQAQMQQPQIQNGGFVSVRSELEARNYPIAPGNSVTFKDETAPYVYTKTMGFSQLDRPIFEKYKLVKEDISENIEPANNDLSEVKENIQKLWGEVDAIKTKVNEPSHTTTRKTKSGGDD